MPCRCRRAAGQVRVASWCASPPIRRPVTEPDRFTPTQSTRALPSRSEPGDGRPGSCRAASRRPDEARASECLPSASLLRKLLPVLAERAIVRGTPRVQVRGLDLLDRDGHRAFPAASRTHSIDLARKFSATCRYTRTAVSTSCAPWSAGCIDFASVTGVNAVHPDSSDRSRIGSAVPVPKPVVSENHNPHVSVTCCRGRGGI